MALFVLLVAALIWSHKSSYHEVVGIAYDVKRLCSSSVCIFEYKAKLPSGRRVRLTSPANVELTEGQHVVLEGHRPFMGKNRSVEYKFIRLAQ